MPRLKVCAKPGCPSDTTGTYCSTHAPKPWEGSTRSKRLPKNWSKVRQRVIRRDKVCQSCGGPAEEVDHITAGDDHSLTNLQALCKPCHQTKTLEEARRARLR